MKINVLEITEKQTFLIKPFELSDYQDYYLNGQLIHPELKKKGMIFKKEDLIETLPRTKEVTGYKKDEQFLSVSDFKSKSTYYDSDSSEEETLRAIANRKEVEGFEPIYKEPEFTAVELEIYGKIEDTGSLFIHSGITDRYSQAPNIYTLNQNAIAVDEYNKLKKQYSTHARFSDLDRSYIEFAKINGNYAFSGGSFYSEKRNDTVFSSLESAQNKEKEIRDSIEKIVRNRVFPDKIDTNKKLMILSYLKAVKKAKSKSVMDEMLQILIEDLQDYKKEIEFNKN